MANKVFPAIAPDDDDDDFKDVVLTLNTNLLELSAGITTQVQEERTFSRRQAENLLELLKNQVEILSKSLKQE